MNNNIAEARMSYGLTLESGTLTQKDAAEMLNVKLSTYKKWEQGQGKLNGEILCMLADAYGCSVDYLLCRTKSPRFVEVRTGPSLSAEESRMLSVYRAADERGKGNIDNAVEFEARQMDESALKEAGNA